MAQANCGTGGVNYPWFERDKNFDSLRGDPEYQAIMADVKKTLGSVPERVRESSMNCATKGSGGTSLFLMNCKISQQDCVSILTSS